MSTPLINPRRTYLVRLWLEGSPGQAHWRGSVDSVPPGPRLYFASLNDLSDFFAFQTEQLQSPDASPAPGSQL